MTEERRSGYESLDEPVLSPAQAEAEAYRCLQCFNAPCTRACPAGIVIPRFIRMIRSGNLLGAAEVVRSANPLAHSCGLACPDEELCASQCTRARIDRPIAIRRLHRMATEAEESAGPRQPALLPPGGKHVAVVGSGPAGLACAAELRRLGFRVTIYEKTDRLGGVLGGTIPLYRFPTRTLLRDASWCLGVAVRELAGSRRSSYGPESDLPASARIRILYNSGVAGVEALARRHDAVFVATGLTERLPSLPNGDLSGIWPADEFLLRSRQMRYKNQVGRAVAVVGGGNVAVDAALAAIRCGEEQAGGRRDHDRMPSVTLLYRRTRQEMPAWDREVLELDRAGVVIQPLKIPVGVVGEKGKVTGLRVVRAVPGPRERDGRRKPVPCAGTEYVLPCDTVILATGMRPSSKELGALPRTREGKLKVESGTGRVAKNIYAGGDLTSPEQTIVAAVRDGKRAARAIAAALKGRSK